MNKNLNLVNIYDQYADSCHFLLKVGVFIKPRLWG